MVLERGSDKQEVRVTTIDQMVAELGLPRVDFITMDIEGAEKPALRGAAQTLRKFKPRMAIASEHLPDDVYKRMLAELARVIRPAGHLLLMQGNTLAVEHIHVLPEGELVRDVKRAGFELMQELPDRHYLFRRAQS